MTGSGTGFAERRLRVTVASIGRFHSADLAAQLDRRRMLACFYTGYPRFKLRDSGIEPARIRSYPWLQAPYMALAKQGWFQRRLERPWARLAHQTLDRHIAATLPDCDLISVLSGSGVVTAQAARRRGIRYVCDRGSTHIVHQDRVLREEYERLGLFWAGVDPGMIDRELAEYEAADAITVPSQHVRRSFLAQGIPPERLVVVPYGVDLARFRRTAPRDPGYRVLFAGSLSVRKGLHYLLQAFALADLTAATLVLAGPAQPETAALLHRFPVSRVEVLGHLSRADLAREMSRASVMVLPSIEEGLALVQAQALACGCPVIATAETGSEDLYVDGQEGFIVAARSPEAIADRLHRLHADRTLLEAMSVAAVARVGQVAGWGVYADNIAAAFRRIVAGAGAFDETANR